MNVRFASLAAISAAGLVLTAAPALAADAPGAINPTDVKLYLPTTLPDGTGFGHGQFVRDGKVLELPANLTVRGKGVFNGANQVFKVTGDKHDKVTGEVSPERLAHMLRGSAKYVANWRRYKAGLQHQ